MNEREVSKSYWINAKKRINVNRFSLSSNALSASELFNIRTPYRSVYYYYCINQRYYLQHNLAVQLYVHMYIENEHEVHEYDIHSHAHMPNMQYLFVVLKWFLTDCYCDHIMYFCFDRLPELAVSCHLSSWSSSLHYHQKHQQECFSEMYIIRFTWRLYGTSAMLLKFKTFNENVMAGRMKAQKIQNYMWKELDQCHLKKHKKLMKNKSDKIYRCRAFILRNTHIPYIPLTPHCRTLYYQNWDQLPFHHSSQISFFFSRVFHTFPKITKNFHSEENMYVYCEKSRRNIVKNW